MKKKSQSTNISLNFEIIIKKKYSYNIKEFFSKNIKYSVMV